MFLENGLSCGIICSNRRRMLMKLNIAEYRWVLLNCNVMVGQYKGEHFAIIEAKYPKHQAKLDKLLNMEIFPTIDDWNKIARDLHPQLQQNDQSKYIIALKKLSEKTIDELAKLDDEEKILLLDHLILDNLPRDQNRSRQNRQTILEHREKIIALLFNITLPKEFVEQERQKLESFCKHLLTIPQLKEDLESWHNISLENKRKICRNFLQMFNHSYKSDIKLKFFCKDDWEEDMIGKASSLQNQMMPTGYTKSGNIYVNNDRMDECNNLAIPQLIFHEGLLIAQEQKNWEKFPIIDKLFESKFTTLAIDKNDLRVINPIEAHTYGINKEISRFLREDMRIKFVDPTFKEDEKRQPNQDTICF